MKINLNVCTPGQLLKQKCGNIAIYIKCDPTFFEETDRCYPHLVCDLDEPWDPYIYTDEGLFSIENPNSRLNIVEILPLGTIVLFAKTKSATTNN
jgi:hypothetical protein